MARKGEDEEDEEEEEEEDEEDEEGEEREEGDEEEAERAKGPFRNYNAIPPRATLCCSFCLCLDGTKGSRDGNSM